MKKRIFTIPLLILFLGASLFISATGNNGQKKVEAEALPLPYYTFTNTAINQAVAIKGNNPVSVDVASYKFFAIEMQLTPLVANTWGAYSFSLINNSDENVLSLDSSAAVRAAATANGYPAGLTQADYAGSTGNARIATDRINLPTTEKAYFAAQKNTNYASTIKLGFTGTIFFYLPDYTSINLSDVYGVKIINKDQNRTIIVSNTYFCEGITKLADSGFTSTGSTLDFNLTTCTAVTGTPTIKAATSVTEGYGLSSTSTSTSEVVVSFKDQVNVSLNTYRYLALDMTITSPASTGYLNIAAKIYDNARAVTNNLLMTYAKASAAQSSDEYPDALTAADWSSATGGRRINLPSETYARVSCLTSIPGIYVPMKADNSYNLVFKGGSTYTTYIYLPDFGVDNFDLNALSLTSTGASTYILNQVYLCESVTKVADSTKSSHAYYPTGNKLVLPIISAYSYTATLAETSSISVLNDTYYKARINESIINGSLSYLIYQDELGNEKIDITPAPNIGYSATKVTMNGVEITDVTGGVYTATLTEDVVLSAEFHLSLYDINFTCSQSDTALTELAWADATGVSGDARDLTLNSISNVYAETNAIKLGSTDSIGSLTVTVPSGLKIAKVIIHAVSFGTNENATIKVNSSLAQSTSQTYTYYTFDLATTSETIIIESNSAANDPLYVDDIIFITEGNDKIIGAYGYAALFLNTTSAECAQLNVTSSTWSTLSSEWASMESNYVGSQTYFGGQAENADGNIIQQAVARYEFIASKYVYSNFMGRPLAPSAQQILLNSSTNNSIVIISIVSAITLAVVGCLIFKRKREKHFSLEK